MMEVEFGSLYLFDDFSRYSSMDGSQKGTSPEYRSVRPKILIVDDERLIADTLCEILESAGFEVAVAYDGWQAIEKAARFKPDQMLTDVKMPGINGVELAMAIRKMYPSTKILLFSAQAGASEIFLDAETQGFHFELLAKPLHPSDLIKRLKDLESK
jgi:CheY-like chemotaxis protein